MSTLCIYDKNDFDGKCSAAIVRHTFPDCKLLGWRYGEPIGWDYIEEFDTVIMVDLSFDRDDMVRLDKMCDFYWIDHHTQIIEEMEDQLLQGAQDDTVAACIQTWDYFQSGPLPLAVELLGKWDVWDHEDPRVGLFQAGLKFRDPKVTDSIWEKLFKGDDDLINEIMSHGLIVQKVYDNIAQGAMQNAFNFEFHGLNCVGVNNQQGGSPQFKSVDGDDYDAQFVFRYTPAGISCSMYSIQDYVDVGKICKSYGGGGRKGCGGFIINQLPFNINEVLWLK